MLASVGDSRIYLHADGALTQLSQDDTWVAIMLGQGDIDSQAATNHPMKHVLTNVLGAREQIEFGVTEHAVAPGGTLLFASDGLHGAVDRDAIARILAAPGTAAELAEQLLQAALDGGGIDNITAIVVRRES